MPAGPIKKQDVAEEEGSEAQSEDWDATLKYNQGQPSKDLAALQNRLPAARESLKKFRGDTEERRRLDLARKEALLTVKTLLGEALHDEERQEAAAKAGDGKRRQGKRGSKEQGRFGNANKTATDVALFKSADQYRKELFARLDEKEYNVEDFYRKDGRAVEIATSAWFNNLTLMVIVSNVVWIGIESDFNKADQASLDFDAYLAIEYIYMVFYTFEIGCRWMCFEKKMQAFKDYWFIFDFSLVVLMLFENLLLPLGKMLFASGELDLDLGFLNVMKIFRLLRLFRVVRVVRSVPELMTVIKSMAAAVRSVAAICCLLAGSVYVFAVIFRLLHDSSEAEPEAGNEDTGRFDTLLWSMFTLIEGTLSGEFPQHMVDPLKQIVYLLHLLFSHTLMLSMLIGLMCQIVTTVGGAQKEKIAVQECRTVLRSHFDAADVNKNGKLDIYEFFVLLQVPDVIVALREMDIDVAHWITTADFVFETVDEISFAKFIEVALNLRASNFARVSDVVDIRKLIFSEMHEVQARQRMSDETFLQGFTELESRQKSFQAQINQQLNDVISLLGGQAKQLPQSHRGTQLVSYHDVADWPTGNDLSFHDQWPMAAKAEEMHHF
jgi:hypothetical protein